MQIAKVQKTTLKAGLAADGTSIQVKKFVDSKGAEVALSDFGTYFAVVIKQGNTVEIIKCDGITQSSSDDSATLSVATSGRDLSPKSPYTGGSTGNAFSPGAEVIVTNDPFTMSFFIQGDIANTFSAVQTFSVFPEKSGSLTPTDDEQFATKAYVDATATGDAVTSALKSTVTYGEDVSAGDPVYLKTSDGKWWRAYANDPDTCIGVQLGIATEAALADAEGVITRKGRDTTQTGMTINADYYLTDAGALSTTAGSYVVKFGTAVAATVLAVEIEDGDRKQFLGAVTGMLIPYALSTTPAGFLTCDGSAYNLSAYPDLVAALANDSLLTEYGLNDGQAFTVTAANDTIDIVSHGFSNGQQFVLTNEGGALPAGLSANTLYYVVSATTNTFKLSLTEGGSAVDITGAGTGTHYLHSQFRVPNMKGATAIGKGQRIKTFTFVDADVNVGSDVITVDSNLYLYTGQSVVLSTSGTLPTGLSATTYYVIRVSATTIKLATSVANANYGTAVNITAAAGGGTHTLTLTMTNRAMGDEGGSEYTAEVPSHFHQATSLNSGSDVYDSSDSSSDNSDVVSGNTGGNTPNNMPPFVTVNWIIKT